MSPESLLRISRICSEVAAARARLSWIMSADRTAAGLRTGYSWGRAAGASTIAKQDLIMIRSNLVFAMPFSSAIRCGFAQQPERKNTSCTVASACSCRSRSDLNDSIPDISEEQASYRAHRGVEWKEVLY